jgi:cysteine-rich CPCC protein
MVFEEGPGSHDICPVCGWEDDDVQLRHPGMAGGANQRSLWEDQQDLLRRVPLTVLVQDGFERDPTWRALKPDEVATVGAPRTGLDDSHPAGESESPHYYWKASASPEAS